MECIGTFMKQRWTATDHAEDIEEVEFDFLPWLVAEERQLSDIHELEDCDYSSDNVGLIFVNWDGPHYVYLEEAVCNFFLVDDIQDITEELLQQAKAEWSQKESQEFVIPMKRIVKAPLRVVARSLAEANLLIEKGHLQEADEEECVREDWQIDEDALYLLRQQMKDSSAV